MKINDIEYDYKDCDFNVLQNAIITGINRIEDRGEDHIIFDAEFYGKKRKFIMYHKIACCESVWIADWPENIEDVIGSPVLVSEERTCEFDGNAVRRDQTWTFYEIATIKGSVTIRWVGESDYYSRRVDFEELIPKKKGNDMKVDEKILNGVTINEIRSVQEDFVNKFVLFCEKDGKKEIIIIQSENDDCIEFHQLASEEEINDYKDDE